MKLVMRKPVRIFNQRTAAVTVPGYDGCLPVQLKIVHMNVNGQNKQANNSADRLCGLMLICEKRFSCCSAYYMHTVNE